MNKTLEFMAFGLPTVAFDLHETRFSAGDSAVYAVPNEVDHYARSIVELLDDGPHRVKMGDIAIDHIRQEFACEHQSPAYVGVYDRILNDAR